MPSIGPRAPGPAAADLEERRADRQAGGAVAALHGPWRADMKPAVGPRYNLPLP